MSERDAAIGDMWRDSQGNLQMVRYLSPGERIDFWVPSRGDLGFEDAKWRSEMPPPGWTFLGNAFDLAATRPTLTIV
jgi:hypothetical protein